MKIYSLLIKPILALAGLPFFGSSAHATVSAAQGDLVLGFRITDGSAPNGTFNLEIALPSFSIIDTAAIGNGGTIDLNYGEGLFTSNNGGLAVADLITAYGSGWSSRANFVWSVAGHSGTAGQDAWSTFASAVTTANSTIGTTTAGANNSFATKINGEIGGLIGAPNTINGQNLISLQAYGPADSISSSYKQTVGTAAPWYGVFAATAPVERQVNSATDTLNLWQFSGGAAGTRTLVGTFALADNGNFTYTTAAPEPTSAVLLGAGALALLSTRRRRVAGLI